MPNDPKRQVAFRFPQDLLTRIESYRRKLSADMPGLDVNQATTVRVLIEKALAAEGFPPAARTRKAIKGTP